MDNKWTVNLFYPEITFYIKRVINEAKIISRRNIYKVTEQNSIVYSRDMYNIMYNIVILI